MEDKILVLASKKHNMKTVLEWLVYGADVTRPEQRGLLSAERGDTVLLYDIDQRLIMGPFQVTNPILYSTEPLWGEDRWPYRITLEPSQAKIGVLRGRRLLDLLLAAGRLSLREPSALETYWIHPLVLDEAREILEGFLDKATYHTHKKILEEYYKPAAPKPWQPPENAKTLDQAICETLSRQQHPDWAIEALIPRVPRTRRKLSPPARNIIAVNGLHLYHRRYLDIAFFTRNKYTTIIEVKRSPKNLEKALDQLLYYTYAVSKGFNIKRERITPILAIHGKQKQEAQQEIEEIIIKLTTQYETPSDRITIVNIQPTCKENKPDATIKTIW